MMYSIQWYDPFMPKYRQPFKDGNPRGMFYSERAAREIAESLCNENGFDLPFEIVEVPPDSHIILDPQSGLGR